MHKHVYKQVHVRYTHREEQLSNHHTRYHFETVVYLQTQLLQIVSMEIYHLESVVSGDVFVSLIKAANHVKCGAINPHQGLNHYPPTVRSKLRI